MKRPIFVIILAGLVLLIGFGIAVLATPRPAPVDAQALAAANELVAAGHPAEAAQMYEQMIAQGARDAALYYNLGNAYFLQGDASRAMAAYEQAAALAPRDADIRANLALAQEQAGRQMSWPAATDIATRWLTVDELALLALGAWLALGLVVLTYRTRVLDRYSTHSKP
jgi:tetratricopeptide (TPR) repeat protein